MGCLPLLLMPIFSLAGKGNRGGYPPHRYRTAAVEEETMRTIRQPATLLFADVSRTVYRNPIKAIFLVLFVTLPFLLQLARITVDTTNESFFAEDDPVLVDYNVFRNQFGRDEYIIVAITPPEIFDRNFLHKLRRLHKELEEKLPYVEEIDSLINARNTRGEGELLIVEDLVENIPETEAEMVRLKKRVITNPFYRNTLISADGRHTALAIKAIATLAADNSADMDGFITAPQTAEERDAPRYLSNIQIREMVDSMQLVLQQYSSPDFSIHVAGLPVVVDGLDRLIRTDMKWLPPLSLLMTILFLFIMFRRISGVIYPLVIVALSLLSTFGLMAWAGIAITNITQILPTFMIVVGIGDSVHILAFFYQQYRKGGDRESAVVAAFGHAGLAVVMTSLTTAVGLASLMVADVAPVADLGIAAPAGVLLAMFYTILLLPAFLSLFPVVRGKEHKSFIMDRLLAAIARLTCRWPWQTVILASFLTLLATAGAGQLEISHNGLKWLPEDSSIRKDTAWIDQQFAGSITLEAVIDSGSKNGLYDPGFLRHLEEAAKRVEEFADATIFVGKVMTLTTVIKEIHQALNDNRRDFYVIPDKREVIAQEFLLFENSGADDLEEIVDTEFRKVRLTIKTPYRDASRYRRLIAAINDELRSHFPAAEIRITGIMALFSAMVENIITTMIKSYIIALLLVTLLMILLFGNLRIGLLAMIPNLVPILLLPGLMAWLNIPVDMATILVGTVAIGLVVDDTIHFMHNYRRFFAQSGSAEQAVKETLDTTGRAMVITSIVLSSGFFINMFSSMASTYNFGLLTGAAVLFALFSDLFLAPALLVIAARTSRAGAAGLQP